MTKDYLTASEDPNHSWTVPVTELCFKNCNRLESLPADFSKDSLEVDREAVPSFDDASRAARRIWQRIKKLLNIPS